ncbi:hypothetical protein MMC13_006411 [Lambiella insularis]|nr:hypothetical protein [Lambiella insularis]
MVTLPNVQSSNALIASALPPGLVAVFVGATNGIGATTLKQLAKHARQPRVYFVGRSQEAGELIAAECKALNSEGEYNFIRADTSLIRTVDDVCRDIKAKEKSVNLLFLSTGTLIFGTKTSEGLHYASVLVHYSRARFILNLLPLLQQATALRRVVSVFTGGKEGPVDTTDLQGWNVPMLAQRGHASSLVTLSLEVFAKKAPNVSFIHGFPGPVKSGIGRGTKGALMFTLKAVFTVRGLLVNMPVEECGERHLFLATSARYPAGTEGNVAPGVPLAGGVKVARGTDGNDGSGVYSIDQYGESAGPKVEELLAKMKKDGTEGKIWNNMEEEFKRIAGEAVV